jgi:acetyl-CoA acyltransferase
VTSSAVVVDAVRTPFGSHNGKLSTFHAVDLLAAAFKGVLEHSGLSIDAIDQVIAGCATPVGEQAINIARNAVLAAGWAESLSAHTVDAQGTSGVLALHEALARVTAGMSDVCLVGAVASTRVPDGASTGVAVGKPFGSAVHDRYAEAGGLRSPGVMAEYLAQTMNIDREMLDAYAQTSAQRARESDENGTKKPYLLEIRNSKKIPTVVAQDEKQRGRDITKLKALFEKDGLLTAATFATPVSGAVAFIVARADALPRQAKPIAEVVACASMGADVLLGSSGSEIAQRVVKRAKPSIIEVQEDTAVTPVAFASAYGASLDMVNRHGGALSMGDAFGVSGLASIVDLVHGLDVDNPTGLAISSGSNAISTATLLKIHTR